MSKSISEGPYRWAVWVALALCYLFLIWQTAVRVRDAGIASLAENGRSQLNLYVTHLRGQLEKYEYLPELFAIDGRLAALLKAPSDPVTTEPPPGVAVTVMPE